MLHTPLSTDMKHIEQYFLKDTLLLKMSVLIALGFKLLHAFHRPINDVINIPFLPYVFMTVFPYTFANGNGLCMDGMTTISKELNRSCSNQNYTPGTIDWWVPKLKLQPKSPQNGGKGTQIHFHLEWWHFNI